MNPSLVLRDLQPTGTGRIGTVQEFVVPRDGRYRIEAVGAQGGTGPREGKGGKGARIEDFFELKKDEVLSIAVGQMGQSHATMPSGGGGSFVAKKLDGYEFLQLSDSRGTLPAFPQEQVSRLKVQAVLRITTNSDIRLLNTPNDESFSIYCTSRRMAFQSYWAQMQHSSSEATIPSGQWSDVTWDIDFLNGIAYFYIGSSLRESWIFSPFVLPMSALELFSRGSSSIFSGHIGELRIEVNEELFAEYREFDEVLLDSSGNDRHVELSGSVTMGSEDRFQPLLVAGGGGGCSGGNNLELAQEAANAHLEEWGKDGVGGVTWGFGGQDGSAGTSVDRGGAGAGFFSSASNGGGTSFVEGALGGSGHTNGGFGGGGGINATTTWGAGGGGGGYSGGGGGYSSTVTGESAAGGGGGSFSAGASTTGDSAFREGHGYVRIFVPSRVRSGRAITETGQAVDRILVFTEDGTNYAIVHPGSQGNWEQEIPTGIPIYFTYLAEDFRPKTFGPYTF